MSDYRLPYGHGVLTFTLPPGFHADLIAPVDIAPASDPLQAVAAVIESPVGGARLTDFIGAKSAAIAINDKTRPVRLDHILPPLLQRLEAIGISKITLITATGTHLPMTANEFAGVVPADILNRYPVISHDCDDENNLVELGVTRRGSVVKANRQYWEADLRLALGNIEPHQFAGFSGGVKTAAIGLNGRAGINNNHALMLLPESRIGEYETNPVRQDIEEMGALMKIHFALNTILNNDKQIVYALFGDPVAVMQTGIPLSRQVCQVTAPAPYDLLIIAPGGHPKDINLYQGQKALGHATLIMREGGTVIFCAACPEGAGSRSYEEWLAQEGGMRSHAQVLERFKREGFRIGPHKAFQIARDGSRVNVLFKTQMPPDFVRFLLLTPIDDLQTAVSAAVAALPPTARIGVMPIANATIPRLENRVSNQ